MHFFQLDSKRYPASRKVSFLGQWPFRLVTTFCTYPEPTPRRAIVFGDLKGDIVRPIWSVTAEQADQLNKKLAASSHEMIFADSESVLLAL